MFTSRIFLNLRRWGIASCLLAEIAGCGKPKQAIQNRATVSGMVTFDGKPLPAGVVQFQSTERTVTTSANIYDGTYTTDRAPLGKNTVTIDTSSIVNGNPHA